jgi:leucyl-tRNA---protein transferase
LDIRRSPASAMLNQSAYLPHAPPALMDALWAQGWRHFGPEFFRYSHTLGEDGGVLTIQPLRLPLAGFQFTKNQRRLFRRNEDAAVCVVPAVVDEEREALFLRHRARFTFNIPDSLRTFIPPVQPCECVSVEVRTAGRLVAVSYLDVGAEAVSSVYAMFAPEESARSLGTLTLLEEIRWAAAQGKRWLYPGYATREPSHYDYKKQLRGLEFLDWPHGWRPLAGSQRSAA